MQIVLEAQRLEQWLTVDQRVEEISTTGSGAGGTYYLTQCALHTSNMKKNLRTEVDEKSVGNLGALTLTTI